MIHYIYIPGLGDKVDPLRRLALLLWRRRGARAALIPMKWAGKGETYEQKYERVANAVRASTADEIVLIGESAGGPMALLAYSRLSDRVGNVITICGYNHGASDIHPRHRTTHPAFYELVKTIDTVLPSFSPSLRSHMTTIYSTKDTIVTESHSKVEGAKAVAIDTPGHMRSITSFLLRGPWHFDASSTKR